MRIFGPVIQGLGQALDLYQARHRVLAENVANAETPGYRARDLDFGSALARAFEANAERGAADGATEMSRLSQNALKIVALSQIIAKKYAGLRAVITDGRA